MRYVARVGRSFSGASEAAVQIATQIADWRHHHLGDTPGDGFSPTVISLADLGLPSLASPSLALPGPASASLTFLRPAAVASALVAPAMLRAAPTASAVPARLSAPIVSGVFNPGAGNPGIVASGVVGAGADQALQAAQARATTGLSGSGIRIGILSDSFNMRGGYAADVADGALPANVTVLKDGPSTGNDEGRAMAQLVHQVAPGAQIFFYTAFDGESDFASGISALAAAGCQAIVDDVTYLDEPFFGTSGLVQAAVAKVVAQGVNYFTAASNEGSNFFQSGFAGISASLPGISGSYLAENFGSAARPNGLENLSIAAGSTTTIDLQWEQTAGIADTAASSSLGMVLYDATGKIVAYAMADAVGGTPDQILQFTKTTASTDFHLAIVTNGGPAAPGMFKFIVYGQGTVIEDRNAGIGSGTAIGHETVAGANTVGAIDYTSTAAFGGGGVVEGFSSVGPSVGFVAPDGAATSVFNPFFGTSAAAPNAAAVAALVLQADPSLTPAEVSAVLTQTATPVRGAEGATGAGLIDAAAAVRLAAATAAAGNATALLAGTTPAGGTAAIAASLSVAASPTALTASGFSAALADSIAASRMAQNAGVAGGAHSLAMVSGFDPVPLPSFA